MAANPPLGAYIDYVLPHDVHGPVTLHRARRARRAGALVQQQRPPALAQPGQPGLCAGMGADARATGDHARHAPLRLEPALRRAGPACGGQAGGDGVWAPPGHYTVELTVDGRTLRQPLTVKPDPRVKLTQAAYEREFHLARMVEAEQGARDAGAGPGRAAGARAGRAHRGAGWPQGPARPGGRPARAAWSTCPACRWCTIRATTPARRRVAPTACTRSRATWGRWRAPWTAPTPIPARTCACPRQAVAQPRGCPGELAATDRTIAHGPGRRPATGRPARGGHRQGQALTPPRPCTAPWVGARAKPRRRAHARGCP